jgi:hypothetical protein
MSLKSTVTVASNAKNLEQNQYFIPKLVKFTMYFSEILIFGPFWEGASGEIKNTFIKMSYI